MIDRISQYRISKLRNSGNSCRQNIIVHKLAERLYPQLKIPENSPKLVDSAIRSLKRLGQRSDVMADKDISLQVKYEISALAYLRKYLCTRKKNSAADGIYHLLATKGSSPKISIDDDAPLELIKALNPTWAAFAFSQLHNVKICFTNELGGSAANANYFENKINLNKKADVYERAWLIAHEMEHLLFDRYIHAMFHYPVFTKLCFPFTLNYTNEYNRETNRQFKEQLFAINLHNQTNDENCFLSACGIFSEIRALLRGVDMIMRIGVLRGVNPQGLNIKETLDYSEFLRYSRAKINIVSKMIGVASHFELTELGQIYLKSEENNLRELEYRQAQCKKLKKEAFNRWWTIQTSKLS